MENGTCSKSAIKLPQYSIYKDKNDIKYKNKLVKAFCNMHLQFDIDTHDFIKQFNLKRYSHNYKEK